MTQLQALRRYPHVPPHIIKWAIDNIADVRDVERGLARIEQERRVKLKYAS